MNLKEDFKELYAKYTKEVVKKSIIIATLISAFVLAVTSFVLWFFGVKQFWISLIVFFVSETISFMIGFYVMRPNEKNFTKKIDELGLKQRAITMLEYKNDDSLMARVQRANAVEHINKVNSRLLKLSVRAFALVLMYVAIGLGTALTTVSALSAYGVIGNGSDLLDKLTPETSEYYEVQYLVKGNGTILLGDAVQTVKAGDSTMAVLAEPEKGYMFKVWSDGVKTPYRFDENVQNDFTVYAIFVEFDGEAQNVDRDRITLQGSGGNVLGELPGKGEIQDEDFDIETLEKNQVIDGKTYYGKEVYEEAAADVNNQLQGNGTMKTGRKQTIINYIKGIGK